MIFRNHPSTLDRAASRSAAIACAARSLGAYVDSATASMNAGHVDYTLPTPHGTDADRQRLYLLLVGDEGETRLCGRGLDHFAERTAAMMDAWTLAERAAGDGAARLIAELRTEAREYAATHVAKISLLAHELAAHGRLSGPEIDAVLGIDAPAAAVPSGADAQLPDGRPVAEYAADDPGRLRPGFGEGDWLRRSQYPGQSGFAPDIATVQPLIDQLTVIGTALGL